MSDITTLRDCRKCERFTEATRYCGWTGMTMDASLVDSAPCYGYVEREPVAPPVPPPAFVVPAFVVPEGPKLREHVEAIAAAIERGVAEARGRTFEGAIDKRITLDVAASFEGVAKALREALA